MNKIKRLACFAAAFLLIATSGLAQTQTVTPEAAVPGQWVWIGDVRVRRLPSSDTLRLSGLHTDFRAIKFSVANATVHLETMRIRFDDGSFSNIGIGVDIPPDTLSPAYDLPGGRRTIRRIEFWHQTAGSFRGPGVVSVFGLK